jgi:hypothetical protein
VQPSGLRLGQPVLVLPDRETPDASEFAQAVSIRPAASCYEVVTSVDPGGKRRIRPHTGVTRGGHKGGG